MLFNVVRVVTYTPYSERASTVPYFGAVRVWYFRVLTGTVCYGAADTCCATVTV